MAHVQGTWVLILEPLTPSLKVLLSLVLEETLLLADEAAPQPWAPQK